MINRNKANRKVNVLKPLVRRSGRILYCNQLTLDELKRTKRLRDALDFLIKAGFSIQIEI